MRPSVVVLHLQRRVAHQCAATKHIPVPLGRTSVGGEHRGLLVVVEWELGNGRRLLYPNRRIRVSECARHERFGIEVEGVDEVLGRAGDIGRGEQVAAKELLVESGRR